MKSGLEFKRLLIGAAVTAAVLGLAMMLGWALAPPIGTSRPTSLDLLFRMIPIAGLVAGAYVGTRRGRGPRMPQGIASIFINWLAMAVLLLIADRITGDNIFDPLAVFVTAAPLLILLGAAGVAIASFTDRRATRLLSESPPAIGSRAG